MYSTVSGYKPVKNSKVCVWRGGGGGGGGGGGRQKLPLTLSPLVNLCHASLWITIQLQAILSNFLI